MSQLPMAIDHHKLQAPLQIKKYTSSAGK